jgi:hypothetical protein
MKLVITIDSDSLREPSKEDLEEIVEALGRFCAIHYIDYKGITVQTEESYESYHRGL